jgi:hypothetical protein
VQVTGNDSEAIGGARATAVTHDDSLTVSGNLGISVAHQATISATDKIQATQGSSTLAFESNHVALDGGTFVRLHSPAGTIEIGVDGGTIRLNAGQRIRIEAGSATVTLASDGTITLAGARLALN